jgi:hypothetical protein
VEHCSVPSRSGPDRGDPAQKAGTIKWAKSWDEVADIGEKHLAEAILGSVVDTP